MSNYPLVSVVIIFLNEEEFIEESIESVFGQTYSNWELLLVDDGSSDNISVVLAEVGNVPKVKMKLKKYLFPPSEGLLQKMFDFKWWITAFIVVLILVLLFVFL